MMGSSMTCKLNPCCGDRLNCNPPEQHGHSKLTPVEPAPAVAVPEGWQTIDTAPMDGSVVDLWIDWPAEGDRPARQARSPDAFYDRTVGDWVIQRTNYLRQYAARPVVTHWRLPDAGPAAAAPQPPATRSYEEGKRDGLLEASGWLDSKALGFATQAIDFPDSPRAHLFEQSAADYRNLALTIRSLADEPRHGE